MSLDSIVNVTITAQTKAPEQAGFGKALISGYNTVFAERVREYAAASAVASMISDGFASDHPQVVAVGKHLSQNPKVTSVLVGREENTQKQKIELYPVDAAKKASYDYKIRLNGVELIFTTDASPTVAEICAGLTDAINPSAWQASTPYLVGEYVTNDTAPVKVYRCVQAGTSAGSGGPTGTGSGITDGTCKWDYVHANPAVTATDGTTKVTVESDTVADYFTLEAVERKLVQQLNITPDGSPDGIVDDLTAMREENDTWYLLIETNQGRDVIEAVAAYIETLYKAYFAVTGDDETYDASVTDDVISTLQAAAYARTMISYHHKPMTEFMDAAWAGKGLPYEPGEITWKFKTLGGVSYTDLTETERGVLKSKDGNYYIREAGLNFTTEGITAAHEFFDVVRGSDWIRARLQETIFFRLINAKKIPYTDKGVAVIENEVQAVLKQAINNDFLAADPAPVVTAPLVADVPVLDRANRLLPDVEFSGTLAGAIHSLEIEGIISV
jgi:hypothetical protein